MTCGTELTDGVCLQCCPYPNYYDNTPNYSDYPPQPEYQTYSCESCGNDAHYGYPCPSFVPDPCYNRNFDCFPHDSQTLPQQYLCCENCGGPHETYQCQPMNQEYYNSHSSGFDQFQPPQFSDVYQTPPVTSMEMLHAQTDLIEAMQDFLKKYDHIPHNEKSIKLLLAEGENFWKIKLFLLKDLQILNEIQPLKQETSNQIQKDQEEKSIAELLAEERLQKANQALNESQSPQEMRIQDLEIQKQQCLEEMKEWMNDLGIREYRKEEIDIDYRRKCEDKIYELKDKFNVLGECNLFDIDDSYYEKSTSRLAHLAPMSPEIVEVCVDDDDTDDDDDYDDECMLMMEDTTSIDALPLDDSMILPEYESFTFDNEPTMKRKIPSHSLPDLFYHLSPIPRFSGFWKIHGSILWKNKAMPTISIDGLQSSLHKVGNLLSLSLSN
ncbi:hypothetical protein Tco_1418532 [Tanacetum coccineum]